MPDRTFARRTTVVLSLISTACHARVGARDLSTPTAVLPVSGECTASPSPLGTMAAAQSEVAPVITFDSAWTIIARSHWDTTYNGVNWRALRDTLRPRAAAATSNVELRGILTDMVGRLRQSHFSIIPREVSDATSGGAGDRSGRVGFALRYIEGTMVVSHVQAGSNAKNAGVMPGWTLLAVGACSVASRLSKIPAAMESRRFALTAFNVATQSLAGAVGDTVYLTFLDGAGQRRRLGIAREAEPGSVVRFGNLPPRNAHLEFERAKHGDRTVGIIRFNIWMPVLVAQFNAAIDSLRDVDGMVLDLRGNFGGVGGMSTGIAGHFLDSARTIGTMHQRGATLNFVANPQRVDTRARLVSPYAGPLAIVVDELSISTTEIFAAGMKELGRATVFGSQTAGQALPSVPERLPNGDVLYHAIADFVSPNGKPLEGDGVRPDIKTVLTRKALLAGRDPALDAAVIWAAASAKQRGKAALTP